MDAQALNAVLLLIAVAAAAVAVAYHRRAARLECELDSRRQDPLEGELVIVSTPKPDDQSIRGLVTRTTPAGGLLLTGAVYLERQTVRGGREEVVEVPAAGAIVVPAFSSAQIITDVVAQAEAPADVAQLRSA